MKCPRCQQENLPPMKFCGECGARLAAVCSACGASNAPTQKFCGECGASLTSGGPKFAAPESYTPKHLAEKILTSKAALEVERKQVTVLFADASGSSASFLGYTYTLAGRLSEAVTLLEEALDLAASSKFIPCVSLWTGWLAEANLLQGRMADAVWLAERSLQLALEHKESAYEAFAHRILGDIAFGHEPPDSAKAQTHLHRAMALAEERDMRPLMARCHLGLGKLYGRTGKREQAREHLTTAMTMYREMDMRFWLEQAEAEMRELA